MTEKAAKCPICKNPCAEKIAPFCSSRCSLIDLGKWLGEGYKIEGSEDETEDQNNNPPASKP